MNLVKWFRKNNMKVMAVVVIVIMIGFIGGSALDYLIGPRTAFRQGANQTVAYYGDNKKVKGYDRIVAQQELEILRALQADVMLSSQNLQEILLGELLFSSASRSGSIESGALINYIRRTIRANQYRVSARQINDMYPPKRILPPDIYWICLKNEAQSAGVRIPNEQVGQLLGQIIPQLFKGQTYSQIIGFMMNRYRIGEEQILTTFGKLLMVLQYANMICSNENITSSQLMHAVAQENETIDVEFVEFDSAVFAKTSEEAPSEENLIEHFNKYKKFPAGAVSEENPYGFGYKLPDRVQLEYIAIRLDDVRKIVTPPTQDELEEYYDRNKEQLFTKQVLSDPNDPNSQSIEQVMSYAEVASNILERLFTRKIDSMAKSVLQQARTLTEAKLEGIDIEAADLTAEKFKELAGDYTAAAEQLSKKHNIKVYAGRTGLLSPIEMQNDEYLRTLYVQGYGQNLVNLTQVVFAVDELAVSELGPFDVPRPRMYENIGPATDFLEKIMVVVRVIEAIKSSEPQSIDQTFSTNTLIFDPNEEPEDKNIYSVKEKVIEDLKELTAFQQDLTKNKAEEFIALTTATEDGWDGALDKFNELYGQNEKQNEGDPNVFSLQTSTGMRRMPKAALETLAIQSQGNPSAQADLNELKKHSLFVDQLYSLVPQDSNSVEAPPIVMEFKPDLSYFVIKNISVKRLWQQEYEKTKPMRLLREDHIQTQSLAAIHFNPENILKRMNFRPAELEPADANEPAESGADA